MQEVEEWKQLYKLLKAMEYIFKALHKSGFLCMKQHYNKFKHDKQSRLNVKREMKVPL